MVSPDCDMGDHLRDRKIPSLCYKNQYQKPCSQPQCGEFAAQHLNLCISEKFFNLLESCVSESISLKNVGSDV